MLNFARLLHWSRERMMPIDSVQALLSGSEILKPVLSEHGFSFEFLTSGRGSGGEFATGTFRRENRRLELHFRYSLGLVRYHLNDQSIPHSAYMWSVIGEPNLSHYPGFSDDPLDGFRSLRSDLEEYGSDFLSGTEAEFLRHFDGSAELQRKQPKFPG
jgi:hypothetical protein